MKLNSLGTLRGLEELQTVPSVPILIKRTVTIDKSFMNEIDILSYASSLCLFSARILRDEIVVPNRDITLNTTAREITKLSSLLSKRNYIHDNEMKKKDTKEFFKKVGLKPRHINT